VSDAKLNRDFATDVVRQLRKAGFIAYWAGGCVRDLLRGESPQDYDVATDARPGSVRELFGQRKTVAVGESFGVIIVVGPKGIAPVEVATFRSEGAYLDGRRPESVVFSTPEEDAQRRDFTINGMFYDPIDETVLDFVGGRHDLAERVVRAIGDPAARMAEDKLRLLRAVRFAAVLGFELDPQTAEAVRAMSRELGVVSVERITQELRKMLVHPGRRRAVTLCRDLGLLPVILPELDRRNEPNEVTLAMLAKLDRPSFPSAFSMLLRSVLNPKLSRKSADRESETLWSICRRLKLSNQESEDCGWLHAHRTELRGAHGMTTARLKTLMGHPLFDELLQQARVEAEVLELDPAGVEYADAKRREWSPDDINPPELISGHDVLQMGVVAGPRIKELLATVRESQLNGELRTRDDALAVVKRSIEGERLR
jgi:poly(A) polymerase